MSFAGLHNYVISQFDFYTTQPGFSLLLLTKKGSPFGIADGVVSGGVDARRQSFISLAEVNHLRVLFQLGLLLGRQLRRDARVGRQIGKPGHLLDHLVGWLPEVAGFGVKPDLLVQTVTDCSLLVVKELIPDRCGSTVYR